MRTTMLLLGLRHAANTIYGVTAVPAMFALCLYRIETNEIDYCTSGPSLLRLRFVDHPWRYSLVLVFDADCQQPGRRL